MKQQGSVCSSETWWPYTSFKKHIQKPYKEQGNYFKEKEKWSWQENWIMRMKEQKGPAHWLRSASQLLGGWQGRTAGSQRQVCVQSELQARLGCVQRLFLKLNKQTSRRKAAILQEHKQAVWHSPAQGTSVAVRQEQQTHSGTEKATDHRRMDNDQEHRKKPGRLWIDAEVQVELSWAEMLRTVESLGGRGKGALGHSSSRGTGWGWGSALQASHSMQKIEEGNLL